MACAAAASGAPLADSLVDWLDSDNLPYSSAGAEDDYYLRQNPAYRAANRKFQSISELRLVKGVTAEVWNKLAPFVCAFWHRPSCFMSALAAAKLLGSMAAVGCAGSKG